MEYLLRGRVETPGDDVSAGGISVIVTVSIGLIVASGSLGGVIFGVNCVEPTWFPELQAVPNRVITRKMSVDAVRFIILLTTS